MDMDYEDEIGEANFSGEKSRKKKQPKLKPWGQEWPKSSGEPPAEYAPRARHETAYLEQSSQSSMPFGSPPRTPPAVTGSIANIRHERKTGGPNPPTRHVPIQPNTLSRQSLVLLQCAFDDSMADTTFIVGFDDGDIKEFRTIRALVASTSPVLKKMLYTNSDAHRNSDYVRLSSMTPRAFECIVQFASVTYPEMNCYNVVDTLVAARIYDIGEGVLATLCETWIKKYINPATLCAVINAAFSLNAVDVLEFASHALKSMDCDECLRTDDFLLLCTPALHFILSSEDFAVDEEMLWTRCCEWAQTRFNIARDRFTQLIQDEHAMHQYHQAHHLAQTADDVQYSSDEERRPHRVKPNLAPIYEAPDEEGDEEGDQTDVVRTNDSRRMSRESFEDSKDDEDPNESGKSNEADEEDDDADDPAAEVDHKEEHAVIPALTFQSTTVQASPTQTDAPLQRESSEDDLKAEWQDYLRPLGHLFRYPVMRWAFFVDRVVPSRILHDSCIIEILIYFHDRTRKTTFKTHSRTKTRNHSSSSSTASNSSSSNSSQNTQTPNASNASYPKFRVGDHVRIKPGITPSCGWGSVSRGDIGLVTKVHGKSLVIDFPNHAQWSGLVSEIERIHDYHASRF